jgi:2-polyprenyl-3-methyl-5-hydroxy-6-metoxy-1,4-benzoquinol methylase
MNNCNYCASVLHPKLSLGLRPIVNNLSLHKTLDCNQFLIEMTICDDCGLHQLLHEIDSSHFYTNYMTPSSWKNEPHISELVEHIMGLAKLDDSIIDIGCNDGKFLLELKQQGFTKLQGVEPTKNTVRHARDAGLKITNDYFDINLAKALLKEHGRFNLVISRQVLEHIKDIKGFLESARTLLGDEGFLIIEVPDGESNFKYSDYGVWEEHVNVFTKASLTRIFEESGWEIKNWYRSIFSGWTQTFIVTPSVAKSDSENELGRATVSLEVLEFDSWASNFKSFKKKVMETINELVGESGRVGLFGVGSRSISTLFSIDLINRITSAYDDSQDKISKYIPNTNLKISPTSSMNNDNLDLILLGVNFENEAKILQRLQSEKFLVKSILPPSQILLWSESLSR